MNTGATYAADDAVAFDGGNLFVHALLLPLGVEIGVNQKRYPFG